MSEVFEGGCQCRHCRYRIAGKSLSLFACHCRECQRQSGSAFGMALWIQHSEITLLTGKIASWTRETPSGRHMVCEFCPECGTRLFHRQEGRPRYDQHQARNARRDLVPGSRRPHLVRQRAALEWNNQRVPSISGQPGGLWAAVRALG
ncbi:GFA family protein [Bradyrhizobium sp. BRP14]|nr:GFA family protein [Bradyrhizobium sp. BRP14]